MTKTDVDNIQKSIFEARIRDKGNSPQWVTRALQNIMMPYYVLYVKRQDRLEAVLTNVIHLKEHFAPRLIAKDPHELRLNGAARLLTGLSRMQGLRTRHRTRLDKYTKSL